MDNLREIERNKVLRNLGYELFYLRKIFSTMDFAREALEYGKYLKAIIVAEEQVKGKGRKGRKWISPKGGLWVTIVTPIPKNKLEIANIIAGLAVAMSLNELYGINVRLKWPNDVVYLGFKLGGVLVENIVYGNNVISLIGIGINCNNSSLDVGVKGTISLREILGKPVNREKILEKITANLENLIRKNSISSVIRMYKKYCYSLGKKVKIKVNNEIIEGFVYDITEKGGLVISSPSKGNIIADYGDLIEHEGIRYKLG